MCDVRVNATARLLTTNAYSAHHIAYLKAVFFWGGGQIQTYIL